jgi:hypothetical protein
MTRASALRSQAEAFWRLAGSFNDPGMRSEARSIAATCEEMISDLLREEHATRVAASESAYERARAAWAWASQASAAYRATATGSQMATPRQFDIVEIS